MRFIARFCYLSSGGARLSSSRFGTGATAAAAAALSLGSDSANFNSEATMFARRASMLKNRFRGKSQYEFARNEARRFLESEVPKSNVNVWLEQDYHAIALSQLLRFFEVQPDASLASLLLNKLVHIAEDMQVDDIQRLEATLALIVTRPDENYERAFATVESVLKAHNDRHGKETGGAATESRPDRLDTWHVVDICAKILQRCGKRVPTVLNDHLTQVVLVLLQATNERDLALLGGSLLRIYAWMVRAEREEAHSILCVIVKGPQYHKSYDFATLTQSCGRHHQLHPLPVELIKRLGRTSLEYALSANCRDAAAILSTIARIVTTLQPGLNDITEIDIVKLCDNFVVLLEEYQPRVLRFMDDKDSLYWKHPGDVTTIVFAYELGGRLHYSSIFVTYSDYVAREVSALEPTQLAMATGILRRANRLTQSMADKLSERIETLLGEMKLSELSHICATFASLQTPPAWLHEARAVVLRLLGPDATGLTRLNLAIAFPDDGSFTQVDYSRISGPQLVDILPLVLGNAVFEGPVVATLVTRLTEAKERFSPEDARVLLHCGRPVLVNAINYYLYQRVSEPKWSLDVLYSLSLVVSKGGPAWNPSKALEVAKEASVSPEQFASLVELLTAVFGESDPDIGAFLRTGGDDLLTAHSVQLRTVVRYLIAVHPFQSLRPDVRWLGLLTEKMAKHFAPLKAEELESFLVSLRVIYTDVSKTPALHMLLSDIVERYYSRDFGEPTVQAARITALLVYLQCGMSLPLLTDKTPLAKAVQQCSASYPQDVKNVVVSMPLPSCARPEVKLGRFTLKQIPAKSQRSMQGVEHDDDAGNLFGSEDLSHLDLTMANDFNETASIIAEVAAPEPSNGTGDSNERQRHPIGPGPATAQNPEVSAELCGVTPVASSTLANPAPPAAVAEPHGDIEAVSLVDPGALSHPSQEPASLQSATAPTSYYAKFFSSSVGKIIRRHGKVEDTSNIPSDEGPLQPYGTSPRVHTQAQRASTTPPSAEPVAAFSGWGTPLTPPSSPAEDNWNCAPPVPIVTERSGGGSYPVSATGAPKPAFFGSLFGTTEVQPTAPSPAVEVAPWHAGAPVARQHGLVGNHVYFDPSAQQRNRPIITKKAPMGNMGKPTGVGVLIERGNYPVSAQEPRDGVTGGNHTAGAGTGPGASANPYPNIGVTDFMRHTGVTKITGYDMGAAEDKEVQFQHVAPSVELSLAVAKIDTDRNLLAWQEAAKRVSCISRHVKTKDKTRGQRKLSEWLSAPATRLNDTGTTTTAPTANPSGSKKGGKSAGRAKQGRSAPGPSHSISSAGDRGRKKPTTVAATATTRGGPNSVASRKAKATDKKSPQVSSPRKASPKTTRKASGHATARVAAKKPVLKKPAPARKDTKRRK